MDMQRLRNLTTGRLHTEMGHVYADLESITGQPGLMTHMLPRAMRAVEPWLREHVTDARFWDGRYDVTHTGHFQLPEPTEADRAAMLERYRAQPNPLVGKTVVVVPVLLEAAERRSTRMADRGTPEIEHLTVVDVQPDVVSTWGDQLLR